MKVSISTRTLATVAKSLLPFMAEKYELRKYLIGVNLEFRRKSLYISATDGHRAARVTLDLQAEILDPVNITLTADTWKKIAKIKTKSKEAAEISTICLKELTLTTHDGDIIPLKLNEEGQFPDVTRVLYAELDNREPTTQINVGACAPYLADAFKSAGMLANSKFRGVNIINTCEKSVITIEVPTSESGLLGLTEKAIFTVMPMLI